MYFCRAFCSAEKLSHLHDPASSFTVWVMRTRWAFPILFSCFIWASLGSSEDLGKQIRKAAEMSTLNQPGASPFHLKAVLTPSLDRDKDTGRTGEVEMWWRSPSQWRREVRCPEFHQIQIVDGTHVWQKSEGDYFPEWLREISAALIEPVPLSKDLQDQVRSADVRHLMGNTYLSWALMSSNGNAQKGMGAGISLSDRTGLFFTAKGFGWGGWFRDYKTFHGRQVALTVSNGDPEVTAKVTILEDLGTVPAGWFDAGSGGGESQLLQTVLLDELALRKNLLPMQALSWPALKDGPLEGVLTTEVSVDESGKVREIGVILSDNPGMNEAARAQIAAMRFSPFLLNGAPVQVFSRITLAFKTSRPQGVETFDSARTWFERGRLAGFPAAAAQTPYVLHADFQMRSSTGALETGQYEDTWANESQWRREATLGSSHYVRARNGSKFYLLAEGADARLLGLVFQLIEPIPAMDTFVESDWRIKSEDVDGVKTVRVLSGYESPDGKLDPERARGFWFQPSGNLVKTFFAGIETRRFDLQDFAGVKLARRIDVLKNASLAMRIQIKDISPAASVPSKTFEVKGHEWTRAFTAEAR